MKLRMERKFRVRRWVVTLVLGSLAFSAGSSWANSLKAANNGGLGYYRATTVVGGGMPLRVKLRCDSVAEDTFALWKMTAYEPGRRLGLKCVGR